MAEDKEVGLEEAVGLLVVVGLEVREEEVDNM